MENQKQNNWTQEANEDDPGVREGSSSLDNLNQDNEKREEGNWSNAEKKGAGDYGAEGGRSDENFTVDETAADKPDIHGREPKASDNNYGNIGQTGGVEDLEEQQRENDKWNAQHPGELPV